MRLEPDKKLHSREHVLAEDLSQMLGEPKRFAAYLGIAKRYYERDLRGLARTVREKADLPEDARGNYFFACLRGLMPAYEYRMAQKRRLAAKKRKKSRKKKNKSNLHVSTSPNHKRTKSGTAPTRA